MAHQGPLTTLSSSSSRAHRVCCRLSHPLWTHDPDGVEVGRRLLSALQLLESVCRRMVLTANNTEELDEKAMDILRERASGLHEEVEEAFHSIYTSDTTLTAYMDRTRLATMFPKTRAILNEPPKTMPRTRVGVDSYFQHFGMLNQLTTLAHQIKHDLLYLGNHKYVAHQVAMLYQCLTNAGDPVHKIRQRVEGRFSELKESTTPSEDGQAVKLPFHLAHWLEEILNEVIATVHRLPQIYKDPLVRPTRYMILQASET